VLTFEGSMGIDEMKKAVINMDARAHQIPAPSRWSKPAKPRNTYVCLAFTLLAQRSWPITAEVGGSSPPWPTTTTNQTDRMARRSTQPEWPSRAKPLSFGNRGVRRPCGLWITATMSVGSGF
jgi:hypothetical protein